MKNRFLNSVMVMVEIPPAKANGTTVTRNVQEPRKLSQGSCILRVSVRARRRTAQPERGRSDGQSSTWARVRTGGTMGVARTPRRYTSSTDDTVLRSGRRNTKISGFMFTRARSAGVYYTGVRLMKHGAIIFPTRYLINYSNDNETADTPRRRMSPPCV